MSNCKYFVNGNWVTEIQLKELLNNGLLDNLVSNGAVAIDGFKVDESKLLKAETTKVTSDYIPAVTLANILAKEIKGRQGYTLNMLSALELTNPTPEEKANGVEPDFKIPLWASPYASKFESLLTSLVSNKVVKQKFPGNSYILGSEEGFRIKEGDEAAGELGQSNIVFTRNFDPKKGLQPMRWDFKTKKILPAQIMIPFKFRDESGEILSLKDFTVLEEGGRMILDTTKIPDKLLQLFGFRIPTQERNSMAAVEIVGFLPEASGDLVLAPRDFTKQMGSDFDVDKLYTYMYNHFYDSKTGKLHTNFVSDKKKIKSFIEITKQSIEDLKEEFKLSKEEKKVLNAYIKEATASLSDQDYSERRSKGEETESELAKMAAEILNFSIKGELKEKLDYNINQLSILSRSYKASRQNNILDIHHRIMTSSNPEIISSIMALDSFGEFEQLAKDINSLRNANNEVSIILSDTYQRTKYINATAGKNGVGSFSLDSTFNATAQGKEIVFQNLTGENKEMVFGTPDNPRIPTAAEILAANDPIATFGNVISKGDLSNKYTLRSQQIINRAKEEKRTLTEEEQKSLKYKSTIIRALQSTAVDNEKAQILDKLNINDQTFDVIRAMALLGFEEKEIVGLITQDIIWEFIDKLKDSGSSLTPYNPSAREDIFAELVTKYDPSKSYAALEESRIESLASKSGEELLANIGNKILTPLTEGTTPDFHLEQLALLEKFLKLSDVGKDIKVLQSTINTESSGIPKSLLETKTKVEQIERLPYLNIFNANKLLGNYSSSGQLQNPTTINGFASFYGTMFANKIYDKYFPYKELGFKTLVSEILAHTVKGDTISLAKKTELQQEIFEQVKSYLYSNTNTNLFGDNPDVERRRLFIDTKKNKSLASILNELSTTSWFQKNGFLNKLSFDINKNGTISRVNFEAAAGENLDERNIYDGFNYLLSKNFAIGNYNDIDYTSRILAQELVAAAFLEGGSQGAKQYLKYVPVAYLKSLGFGEYLQGIPFDFQETFFGNLSEGNVVYAHPSTFARQYFQNNPDLAKTVSLSDLEGKIEAVPEGYFTLNPTALENNFVPTMDPTTGEPTMEQTHFLSIYDNKLPSKYALYEFDNVARIYRRISVLAGSYGFVGYNSQTKNSMPVEIQNLSTAAPVEQGAPGYTISNIPATPSKKFDPNVVNNTTAPKTVEDLRIKKSLSGTKEALDDLLNNLETSTEVSTLNTQLIQLIRTLQLPKNFKLVYDDTIESRAFYDSTESIQTLVLNLKIGRDRSVNKLATTVVHELIHTFTSASIKAYEAGELDTLSPKTIAVIQQLKSLQQLYKDELIAKEGPEGLKIFEKQYLDWKAKKADAPKVSAEEISKYYGAIKLEEFVTMALTDEGFQKHLNDITDETGISIWEQLKELLSNLLNALGLDIKPGSALATAIKDSMDLIKANQDALRENNITTAEFIEFGTRYKFEVDVNGKVVKAEYAQGNGVFKAMNAKTQQDKYDALKNKPGVKGKPTAPPVISKTLNVNPAEFTNYSGGAKGSDTAWEEIGKEFGIGKQVNYTPNALKNLTPEQVKEIEDAYQQAVADLKRKPLSYNWENPGKEDYSGGLVRRDYLQAKAADAVFAIGKILERGDKNSKGYVVQADQIDGGTGYAVRMAINLGKPVYVFDLTDNVWMKYNPEGPIDSDIPGEKGRFEQVDDVVLTPKFAGIGTREITEAGKQAIREIYANTFKATTQPSTSVKQSELEALGYGFYKGDDGTYDLNHPEDGIIAERISLEEAIQIATVNAKRESRLKSETSSTFKYEIFPGVFTNPGQTEAINKMSEFLKKDDDQFLLKGRGGTGKTTIVKMIIDKSGILHNRIIGATVADEARGILANNLPTTINTKTMAGLLGLVPDYSKQGDLYFRERNAAEQREFDSKGKSDPIESAKLIIVDEASMISKDLYDILMRKKLKDAKVIFMGDNAQIPPINEDGKSADSPVFELLEGTTNFAELSERMRQGEESPILPVTDVFAENIEDMQRGEAGKANPLTKREDVYDEASNSGVQFISDKQTLINSFVEDFRQNNDPKNAIIVGARNEVVDNFSRLIRQKLFDTEEPFVVGDIIRVNSPHVINKQVEFANGFKGKVIRVAPKGANALGIQLYNITVEYDTLDTAGNPIKSTANLTTVSPENKLDVKKALKNLAAKAKAGSIPWRTFYELKESIVDVGYNYAITAHKVQGSTYKNVYVLEGDIMSFPGGKLQQNRMMYTAVSRPTTKLVIFSVNNTTNIQKSTGIDLSKMTGKVEDYQEFPTSSYGEENDRMNNRPSPDDYEAYQRMMGDELLMESPINSDNLRNYLLICGK